MKKTKSERTKVLEKMDKLTGVKKFKDKRNLKTIENKLWPLCKRLIRKIYGNTCYTCGKEGLQGITWQTGHYIARSVCGDYLYYDLRNLRCQCIKCNKWLSGATAIFREKLIEREGREYVEQLEADRRVRVDDAREHFESLVELYLIKCEELGA